MKVNHKERKAMIYRPGITALNANVMTIIAMKSEYLY